MRRAIISLMVVATFLILAGKAQADNIVDTGWTPSSQPSSLLFGNQWLAAEFSTAQDWYVHEMQGYIDTYFNSGVITVQIFPYNDLGGTALVTRTFQSEDISKVGWQGTSGNTDYLKAGTYWIAFEVLKGSTFNGYMGNTLSPPPRPLSPEAYNFNNEGWILNTRDLGVRILGDPVSPNNPVTRWWVGPNPNNLWTNAQNWSFDRTGPGGAGQPVAGDFVQLQTTTANKMVTYNSTLNPLLKEVRIDGINGFTLTLNQSQYALSVAEGEGIGFFGNGVYNQSGGSNTAGWMFVGTNPNSNGIYNKSGGSLSVGDQLDIGHYGTGTFNQSSGPVTIAGELTLGYIGPPSPAGNGTYKLSGGTLSVGTDETVGYGGTGKFTQAAGTHTVGGSLYVGREAGSTGTFTLSGGSFQVTGDEFVGDAGTGSFNQSGGTNTATNASSLTLGRSACSSGTYKLAGGVLSAGNEFIGVVGKGQVVQTGGTNTNDFLELGFGVGSSGGYLLKGGSLSSTSSQAIGIGGTGLFDQNGGTNTIGSTVILGSSTSGVGTYNLNGGHLQAATEIIGDSGTGTFTQTGGSNSAGKIIVGHFRDGTGTYNLIYGTTVTNELDIGSPQGSKPPGASGTFNLKGGSLSAGFENIGAAGNGTFNQYGGTHRVTGDLRIGNIFWISTYNLKGGSLSVSGNENFFAGDFTQTGGSNSAQHLLMLQPMAYNLKGGSVSASSTAPDAIDIRGTFTVTGIPRVNGNVTNSGTVMTSNASVTWNGSFTNNAAYISDPASQTFTDLTVNPTGYLQGASQDQFIIKNDFINKSTSGAQWNTVLSTLKFATGTDTSHDLYVPGSDAGAHGQANNFTWGSVNLAGQKLFLFDGNTGNSGTALYAEALIGATFTATTLTNISSADLINIYYNANLAANAYLHGLDYLIPGGGGGHLIHHTPVPHSVLLLGSGLLGLGALNWRRKKRG